MADEKAAAAAAAPRPSPHAEHPILSSLPPLPLHGTHSMLNSSRNSPRGAPNVEVPQEKQNQLQQSSVFGSDVAAAGTPRGLGFTELKPLLPLEQRRLVSRQVFDDRYYIQPRNYVEERLVEVPQIQYQDRFIEEKHTITLEKLKPVPRVEVQERVVHVPKHVTREIPVEVPQIQVAERVVEVPTPVYKERLVPVPRPVMEEKIIPVPRPIIQEHVVEVPRMVYQPVEVETVVEVPQVQVQYRYKDVMLPPQQVIRRVPQTMTAHHLVRTTPAAASTFEQSRIVSNYPTPKYKNGAAVSYVGSRTPLLNQQVPIYSLKPSARTQEQKSCCHTLLKNLDARLTTTRSTSSRCCTPIFPRGGRQDAISRKVMTIASSRAAMPLTVNVAVKSKQSSGNRGRDVIPLPCFNLFGSCCAPNVSDSVHYSGSTTARETLPSRHVSPRLRYASAPPLVARPVQHMQGFSSDANSTITLSPRTAAVPGAAAYRKAAPPPFSPTIAEKAAAAEYFMTLAAQQLPPHEPLVHTRFGPMPFSKFEVLNNADALHPSAQQQLHQPCQGGGESAHTHTDRAVGQKTFSTTTREKSSETSESQQLRASAVTPSEETGENGEPAGDVGSGEQEVQFNLKESSKTETVQGQKDTALAGEQHQRNTSGRSSAVVAPSLYWQQMQQLNEQQRQLMAVRQLQLERERIAEERMHLQRAEQIREQQLKDLREEQRHVQQQLQEQQSIFEAEQRLLQEEQQRLVKELRERQYQQLDTALNPPTNIGFSFRRFGGDAPAPENRHSTKAYGTEITEPGTSQPTTSRSVCSWTLPQQFSAVPSDTELPNMYYAVPSGTLYEAIPPESPSQILYCSIPPHYVNPIPSSSTYTTRGAPIGTFPECGYPASRIVFNRGLGLSGPQRYYSGAQTNDHSVSTREPYEVIAQGSNCVKVVDTAADAYRRQVAKQAEEAVRSAYRMGVSVYKSVKDLVNKEIETALAK